MSLISHDIGFHVSSFLTQCVREAWTCLQHEVPTD